MFNACPTSKWIHLSDIAAKFNISQRQAYRYIQLLKRFKAPVKSLFGRGYVYINGKQHELIIDKKLVKYLFNKIDLIKEGRGSGRPPKTLKSLVK